MEQYLAMVRHQIVSAFQWEAQVESRTRRLIRIRLTTGEWPDGGLVSNNEATVIIRAQRDPLGQHWTDMEIPYLAVAGIEHFTDRE